MYRALRATLGFGRPNTMAPGTRRRFAEFARSFGPAWIVMIADVDAASVLTAAENGAAYGYGMIWILVLLIVPLFIVQEAAGRIGAATGKGLGEVVRTTYSRRAALLMTVPMAATDIVSYVAEYTGIAIGMGLLGVPPFVSVPVAFLVHLSVVYKRKYATVERILLGVSLVFIASYVGSLFLRGTVDGSPFLVSGDRRFLYLAVADVGAVVMPFMLFFQASATAEKRAGSVWASRLETLLGAFASEAIMVAIVMVSVGLPSVGGGAGAGELSLALASVAGAYAPVLFGVGLVCAAFLALVVISLAGAWGVAEALGWGRQRYFVIYLAESIPAAIVPLLFPDLIALALTLMVAFVFVLMGPGIIVGRIASRRDVMGDHASRGAWRAAYWLCLALILVFGAIGVAAQL